MKRAVFAIVLLGFGCAGCSRSEADPIEQAPRLEIRTEIAPARVVAVAAPIDGRPVSIAVREGSRVAEGEMLLTLANPAVERDLAWARAQVGAAESRLRSAGSGAGAGSPGEVERALQKIVKNREAKRDRYRALFATRDVSRQELEDVETEYAAAMRDLIAERERRRQSAAGDPEMLRLELDKARADEAFAADRRKQLVIAAPSAGLVTRVHARPGEGVFPRDPLVEITDTAAMTVRAPIAPELIRFIRPGMKVEVRVLTVPPRRFVEPIERVEPPGSSGGAALIVSLPNADGMLQPGTPAVVTVQ